MAISGLTYSENGEQTFRSRTDKINELVAESNRISATYTNEYYVGSAGLSVGGLNPPVVKQFMNNGVQGTDGALRLINTYCWIDVSGGYPALQNVIHTPGASPAGTGQYTIEFYIRPTRVANEYIMSLSDKCSVQLTNLNGHPALTVNFGVTRTFFAPLQINAWNHVCIVVDNDPLVRTMNAYTNGVHFTTDTGVGETLMWPSYLELGLGANANYYPQYDISEITVYSVMFTEEQALERYNGGTFTGALPTGVLDTDRVLYIPYSDASGTVVTNTKGPDGTVYGFENTNFVWTTGSIGAGSKGVFLPTYSKSLGQAAGVTIPVPQNWKLDTQISAHLHFSVDKPVPAGETIILEMEYTIAREDEVFGITVTDSATYTGTGLEQPGSHLELSWPPVSVPGTANHPPGIVATLSRSKTDTFDGDLYFTNFGIKYTAER
jgi:hypothetical protein